MTGHAGKEHLFDRVAVALDAAVDDRRERRARRHRPQPDGHQHLIAQGVAPGQPLLARLEVGRERERMIEIVALLEAGILLRRRRSGFTRRRRRDGHEGRRPSNRNWEDSRDISI